MNLKKMSLLKGIITFSAGFAKEALQDIDSILTHLWLEKKQRPSINLQKNCICIANVHIDSLFEILFRSSVITDVRLVIHESQVKSKSNLKSVCDKIIWDDYIDTSLPIKLKVDSIASELFHEGAMKEVITQSPTLRALSEQVVEKLPDLAANNLFFELLKNKLTVSISLAGSELYKRGYKKVLTAAAPLREDIAHLCLKKSLQFLTQIEPDKKISTLFVPFGGTGTFVFEYIILSLKLANNFFGKNFVFESTQIYKEKTVEFLKKKSSQESEKLGLDLKQIIYSDIAENVSKTFVENYSFFIQKIHEKNETIFQKLQAVELKNDMSPSGLTAGNFLKLDVKDFAHSLHENEVVFMPLNPPYGLRQQSKVDSEQFYTKIIQKMNDLGASLKLNKVTLCAFILCPSEETWSLAMNKLHTKNKETFHFTQGGVHIRAVSVVY